MTQTIIIQISDRWILLQSTASFIRKEVYFPIIDKALLQLNTRFSQEYASILRGIDAFVSTSKHFLKIDAVKAFAKHYRANAEDLSLELRQMDRMLQQMHATGKYPDITTPGQQLLEFTNFAEEYKDAFYELCP